MTKCNNKECPNYSLHWPDRCDIDLKPKKQIPNWDKWKNMIFPGHESTIREYHNEMFISKETQHCYYYKQYNRQLKIKEILK